MEKLTSTEKTCIDLKALRAFHWKASMDADRDPAIRRWHRGQVKIISVKISQRYLLMKDSEVTALVELMTEENAEATYHEVAKLYAGDWQKICELAREAIIRKLKNHPPFDELQ